MIFLKNMILTSSLYESIELVKKFLDKNTESKKILFIPTAANVEEYKKYMHLTQKAFEDFGYEVENFDVSVFSEEIAKEKGIARLYCTFLCQCLKIKTGYKP